ncbi:MAG TPA: non-heme iron oxygenase ferredoxin subunit [Candidatus Nanoarchaeia archaeon]|nr:non-heme iron oxygenase ferredoxin subunit [Candidatus Nanoarchaeia archaeon]
MENFVKVANENDLNPGKGLVVNVNGEEVALFSVDGDVYAISNSCPHRNGPLGEGILEDEIVTCPLHGWQFNVRTGESPLMPARVSCYKVKVENGEIFVSLG